MPSHGSNVFGQLLLAKIYEQIELLRRLIPMVPEDKLEWRPIETSFKICELLGHLLDALAGFCAALYAVRSAKTQLLSRVTFFTGQPLLWNRGSTTTHRTI